MNNTVLSQMRQRLEILYQMVEELEVNPGPGPTPTSDYDDLQNKPQINNITLSGNKTAAQLGLATSSALNTVVSNFEDLITPDNITVEDDGELPSSIDSRLTLHQPIMLNHTVYYFYDESGVDYNYFAVDISGAYPKLSYAQIFKENNRVHFYNFVTDTVPTSGSDNFITSGGTYTALASKQDSLSTAQLNAVNSGITSAKVSTYDSYGTWEEYECFYSAGASSYFDSNVSSVKVKVNRALKRCVADISITTIANIDTSTSAFNFGALSSIPNNTEIRPGASSRTLVVSKADNYTAVISKSPSNSTISFFVLAGTITSGASFSCQLSWDFA